MIGNLLLESLGAEMNENQTVKELLEYLVATWNPNRLPIRPKSVRIHLDMTSTYGSDGVLTNNVSETYNSRIKMKVGGLTV